MSEMQDQMNYNMLVQINSNLLRLIKLLEKEGIRVVTQESHA